MFAGWTAPNILSRELFWCFKLSQAVSYRDCFISFDSEFISFVCHLKIAKLLHLFIYFEENHFNSKNLMNPFFLILIIALYLCR